MLKCIGPAILAVAQLVAGHEVGAQPAPVGRIQVAKLPAQIKAALAHDGRRKRRIIVGREIEVIRLANHHAAGTVHTECGWQQAGFTLVAERKTDGGKRQDGHTLEAHHSPFGLAGFCFLVKLEAGAGDHPGRCPGRLVISFAGRVVRVARNQYLVADKIDPASRAVAPIGQKAVGGLREVAFKSIQLELQFRPPELVARAVDAHIAARIEGVGWLVKLDAVSMNGRPATAQLGIAVNHGFQVRPAGNPVAKNKGGRRIGISLGHLFSQHGAHFEGAFVLWRRSLCLRRDGRGHQRIVLRPHRRAKPHSQRGH